MKRLLLISFVLISFLIGKELHAQRYTHKKVVENLRDFDKKKMHFGFALGFNIADFNLENDLSRDPELLGLIVERQSGFSIGTVADYHILPELNARFLFALSFAQRNLNYTYDRGTGVQSIVTKPVESTYLDFPLNLKYRSLRYNNFAAYIIGGPMYQLDLASKAGVNNQAASAGNQVVKIKRHTMSAQIGVGFDFFLEYFKFGTEVKMSYGLDNILVPDGTAFDTPINSVNSRLVQVSFLFEG